MAQKSLFCDVFENFTFVRPFAEGLMLGAEFTTYDMVCWVLKFWSTGGGGGCWIVAEGDLSFLQQLMYIWILV